MKPATLFRRAIAQARRDLARSLKLIRRRKAKASAVWKFRNGSTIRFKRTKGRRWKGS